MNTRSIIGLLILISGCMGAIVGTIGATEASGLTVAMDYSLFFNVWVIGIISIEMALFSLTILFPMLFLCRKSVAACVICLATGYLMMIIIIARFINYSSPEIMDLGEDVAADLIMYGFCSMPAIALIAIGYFKITRLTGTNAMKNQPESGNIPAPYVPDDY